MEPTQFWLFVIKNTDECWLWIKKLPLSGPPLFNQQLCERVAYKSYHSVQLRKSDQVVRKCNNILCMNPHHMTLTKRTSPNKTHGLSKTRLYRIWAGMKQRCKGTEGNEDNKIRYYEAGIRVCKKWESFESFRDWAFSSGYSDSFEIDRIDNCKGYSPNNCRWVTEVVQSLNRGKHTKRNPSSKYKGVSVTTGKKIWRADLYCNNKHCYLGRFYTEKEAAIAYDTAAIEAFGINAITNFPRKSC